MPGLEDFDRYVDAHGIPEDDYPAAFALWIAQITGLVRLDTNSPESGG